MPENLSGRLVDGALRLAGARPEKWLCPVCGAVVADRDVAGARPPLHEHYGRRIEFIERAEVDRG